jgi:hypothetical protein
MARIGLRTETSGEADDMTVDSEGSERTGPWWSRRPGVDYERFVIDG